MDPREGGRVAKSSYKKGCQEKKLPFPLPEDVVRGGILPDNPEIDKRIAEMAALGRAVVPDDIGPMIAAAAIRRQPISIR